MCMLAERGSPSASSRRPSTKPSEQRFSTMLSELTAPTRIAPTVKFECCEDEEAEKGRHGRCKIKADFAGFCNSTHNRESLCPIACGVCKWCPPIAPDVQMHAEPTFGWQRRESADVQLHRALTREAKSKEEVRAAIASIRTLLARLEDQSASDDARGPLGRGWPGGSRSGVCVVGVMRGKREFGPGHVLGAALRRNREAYCQRCGYRCVLMGEEFAIGGRPAGWDKISLLKAAFNPAVGNCTAVLWMDADVVVMRPVKVEPLTARAAVAATTDYYGFNTGVMLVRRSAAARRLLHKAWRQQAFVENLLGAEQSAIRYVYQHHPELRRNTTIYDNLVRYENSGNPVAFAKLNKSEKMLTPFYHAAGCAMRQHPRSCAQLLLQRTDEAMSSWERTFNMDEAGSDAANSPDSSCVAYDDELSKPRAMKLQDANIPYGQGRDIVKHSTEVSVQRERVAVEAIELHACRVALRSDACRAARLAVVRRR